jgi:tripartite-type tricarboxylate transporter receptor subunit TctC
MKKLFAIFALTCAVTSVMAQNIRVVVPSPGAGTFDKVGRAWAKALEGTLGKPVTVENQAGANGAIGTKFVANYSGPDIVLLASGTSLFINNEQIDGVNDVEPIYYLGYVPEAIISRPDFKYNTAAEFVKNSTERITLASLSNADASTIFKNVVKKPNVSLVYYKGSAQSMTDVIGGHIDLSSAGLANVKQLYDTGKIKILGYAGNQRSPLVPNVPTFAEQGIDMPATLKFYVYASKNADKDQVAQIVKALDKAVASADFAEARKQLNLIAEPIKVSPKQHFIDTKKSIYEILK